MRNDKLRTLLVVFLIIGGVVSVRLSVVEVGPETVRKGTILHLLDYSHVAAYREDDGNVWPGP